MCDPKPGARCSYDTAKELADAIGKLERAELEVVRGAGGMSAARRVELARENLARKQAAYDSAPRGQRELAAAIRRAAEPGSALIDVLRTRLAVGRQTRIDQKRALARAQAKSVAAEHLEAEKALARLRHPEAMLLGPGVHPYDTVGFFTRPDGSPLVAAPALRPRHVLEAMTPARRGADGFLVLWLEGGSVAVGISRKLHTAEEARALTAGRFFDAQLGATADAAPAAGGPRYLAALRGSVQLVQISSAISAVRMINGHEPDDAEIAQLLQLARLDVTKAAIAAARTGSAA